MSRPSHRLTVVCVVGLVLVIGAGSGAASPAALDSTTPTATPNDRTVEEPFGEPIHAVASTPAPTGTAATVMDRLDVTLLQPVDDGVSQLETGHVGGSDVGPLGPTGLAALAGYSRHDDSDPLDNDVRARIHDAVVAAPGIYPAALVDRLDVPRSTVRYHLRVLAEEDLVSERDVDGQRRYVSPEASAAERALAVVDEGTTPARIVDYLGDAGPATVGDLADHLDCSPGTVSYHLDRLEADGVVDRERDGRAVRNRLSPTVRPLIESTQAAASDPFAAAADD
jgi:DNA-binding transcriptional ArsR family regulator